MEVKDKLVNLESIKYIYDSLFEKLPQEVHYFESQKAYEDYKFKDPYRIANGDFILVKDVNEGGVPVYIQYQKLASGENKVFEIPCSINGDVQLALQDLTAHVNAILDSDDTTLDQLSEIVAYIKSNRTLIDAITTSKVSVTDIVNNLTTNLADRPLSAAQGVVLKNAIDEVRSIASQAAGCLIVYATPTNLVANEYTLDRTTLEICYAISNNSDVRLCDTATGFYHHLAWATVSNNMASVVFSGIEHGSGGNLYAVLYYVTPDGIATKSAVQIPSASDVLYSKDLTSVINTALSQAKDSGEFDGTPGTDGGYYTIDVEQLNSQNVKISFTPSKEGMETILPEVITLPQGPQGNPGQDGQDGQDGRDAVIWYANVAPSDNIFPLQSLVGPAGATPAPGDMIVSSYTGQGYFITEVDEVVAVFDDHKVQIKGDPGQDGQPGKDGETGARGTGLLPITTAPSSYTTEVNGLTPTYRIALSTVKSQAGVTEVFAGDTIRYSYYHYPVIYVDASYVYCRARVSIRGATGAAGAAGYSPVRGTDYWTASDIAEIKSYVDEAILGGAW